MNIVAIDTATLVASAAVWRDGAVVAEADATASTHSEKLLPLIDDVLRRAGLRPRDLDAIACGAGPGSFTGLRIGLSTAKGLCYALGRPLILISSLRALAHEAAAGPGELAAAVLDAKKHEVYVGVYDQGTPVGEEAVLPPARLADHVRALAGGRRVVVVGDGAAAYPEAAAAAGSVRIGGRSTPPAAQIARLAAARFEAGQTDDLLPAAPTYIRASEAEIAIPPADLTKPKGSY